MNELALFSGGGGGLLASRLMGWRTRCAVEIDAAARKVIVSRQRDGHLEPFPIWDDIRTFDGRDWRGSVDIVTGGFPCKGISAAGSREGLSNPRSGLVCEMLRVVDEVQPALVFAENSPRLRTNGLGAIIKELDRMGYQSCWCVLGAWHLGALHRRDRMWVLAAHPDRIALRKSEQREAGGWHQLQDGRCSFAQHDGEARAMADSGCSGLERLLFETGESQVGEFRSGSEQGVSLIRWPPEPDVGRVAHGVAHRVDRLRAIGNGQVPRVAVAAFRILRRSLDV